MHYSFESNIRNVERDLSDMARRQVPFATSLALNRTADYIRNEATKRLDKVIDRPTPFTKKAFAVRRSTKRKLVATVFAKPIQAAYLSRLEDGGQRKPKGRALVVPSKIRTNKYGNMPKGAIKRNLVNSKVFSGKPTGSSRGPGIYKRQGKKLVKLVSYVSSAAYRPQLGFERSARKLAQRRFPADLEWGLRKAFSSARR